MASHGKSPDIAELEADLANKSIASQVQGDDEMVPLQTTQLEPAEDNGSNDDSSDSSLSPSRKPAVARSCAKKFRKAAHQTQNSKPLLRPAKDILSRIRHDPALDESEYVVGYHDRHAPEPMEMDVSSWKGGGDFTDEEWIPQHRIVYFRRNGDEPGRKVWDREKRLDRLFGSGIVDQPDKHEEPQDQEDQEEQDGLNNEPRAVVSDQPDDACDSKFPEDGSLRPISTRIPSSKTRT